MTLRLLKFDRKPRHRSGEMSTELSDVVRDLRLLDVYHPEAVECIGRLVKNLLGSAVRKEKGGA